MNLDLLSESKHFYVRRPYSHAYIKTIMSEEHEPEATVYEAVADLERQFYTRREIHNALRHVADSMRPSGGFKRGEDGGA